MKFRCRLCGCNDLKTVLDLKGFPKAAQFFVDSDFSNLAEDVPVTLTIRECIGCSLIQLSNEPVSYFRDVITAASLSEASKNKLVDEWQSFIQKYSLSGKAALEIGCGRGDFLEVMQRLNMQGIGLEHSYDNIKYCLDKNIQVTQGYLLEWDHEKKYSLIVCNNYLEHQPEPGKFIRRMVNLLEDGGLIYISVPNFDYLLGKSCLYEFVADHLVYFTQESLKIACNLNSLEVIESYVKNNGNDIVIVAKKRPLIDIKNSQKVVNEIIISLQRCISRIRKTGGKVAVWGAGHRALALMAISGMDEIEFVVDSADFRQGKFTPLLHKKILSPDQFIKSGCDYLIVMLPGIYAEQIINFIKKENVKCEVIIFDDKSLLE